MNVIQAAIPLILKDIILSSRWAGATRIRRLRNTFGRQEDIEVEIQFSHDLMLRRYCYLELRHCYQRLL